MRGHVYKRGRGWSYVVDIGRDPRTNARRQRTKAGFVSRRDAEEALARVVAGIDTPVLSALPALTLGVYCERWLAGHSPTVKATTAKCYQERLRCYVVPRIGRMKLTDVSPLHIQTLWADLLASGGLRGGPLSASSVAGVRRALRKAMNDAVAWELLAKNPVLAVKGPRVEATEMRTWTGDDARSFIEHLADDRLHALWVLALTTGMRRGDSPACDGSTSTSTPP